LVMMRYQSDSACNVASEGNPEVMEYEEALKVAEFHVRELLAGRNVDLKRSSSLTKDLRIHTDDLSFILVPAIEGVIGRKLPINVWNDIYTVGNLADLIVRETKST
jgi:hypothetical protein